MGSLPVLGVIPARGGSKGVPGKNLRPLAGEPLLVHTVRAALAAALVDRVVVSTDADDIAAVAAAAGAEVVRRPAQLATDESPTEDALLHALDAAGEPGPEWVVTLEPTSPLRPASLIDACVALARERDADGVGVVAETSSLVGPVDDARFTHLIPGQPRRRQLRAPLYRETSAVYVTRASHLRRTRSVLADPFYVVVAPEEQVLDINVALDFVVAEALMRAREEGKR